jgi:hypothetical protein
MSVVSSVAMAAVMPAVAMAAVMPAVPMPAVPVTAVPATVSGLALAHRHRRQAQHDHHRCNEALHDSYPFA